MKAATSLNAYAESYVPLSKRGTFNGQKAFKPPDEFVAVGPHQWYPAVQAPQIHNIHNIDAYYAAVNSGPTGHAVHGYGRLSSFHSSDVKDKATVDEVFENNLAYLQATFPGMSYESLSRVYVANNCDMDSTADMLSHLEHYRGDSSEKLLPDTLDIGDVTDVPEEQRVSSEFPFQKTKDIHIEAGASSSSVSG